MSIILGLVAKETHVLVTYSEMGGSDLNKIVLSLVKKVNIGQHGKFRGHEE